MGSSRVRFSHSRRSDKRSRSQTFQPHPRQSVRALWYKKWSHEILRVSAFRTIDEIDPQYLSFREVEDIHIVLQASLTGSGGFVETDIIYTNYSLTSEDKETVIDGEALSRCVNPFYLPSSEKLEVFQPEIDVERCTLLGRRTVALAASNGQSSLSVMGIRPENNLWIIPFSSIVQDGYRFYIINRFLAPMDRKSVVQLWLMAAMYPKETTDISPRTHPSAKCLMAKHKDVRSDSGNQGDPIVIDETDGCHDTDDT
jgi:hypothetical protein